MRVGVHERFNKLNAEKWVVECCWMHRRGNDAPYLLYLIGPRAANVSKESGPRTQLVWNLLVILLIATKICRDVKQNVAHVANTDAHDKQNNKLFPSKEISLPVNSLQSTWTQNLGLMYYTSIPIQIIEGYPSKPIYPIQLCFIDMHTHKELELQTIWKACITNLNRVNPWHPTINSLFIRPEIPSHGERYCNFNLSTAEHNEYTRKHQIFIVKLKSLL